MGQIKFTYQTIQGSKIEVDRNTLDLDGFESAWVNKIHEKFNDNIVSPEVIVILSADGKNIENSHLAGDGLLK